MQCIPKSYLIGAGISFAAACTFCLSLLNQRTILKHNLADLFVLDAEQTVTIGDLLSSGKTEEAQALINNAIFTDYRIVERDLKNHPGRAYWLWFLAEASRRRNAIIPDDLKDSFSKLQRDKPTPGKVLFGEEWIDIGNR